MPTDRDQAQNLQEIWRDFLNTWPLSRIRSMSIEDYTKVGCQDSFTVWLESRTSELGSIWGGSSFKFGVYNRKSLDEKSSSKKYTFTDQYAWDNSLGETAEEAFNNVKSRIIEIIEGVQQGIFPDMDRRKLWPIVELKIAFLYQNKASPLLVAVYTRKLVEAFLSIPASKHGTNWESLYQELLEHRGDEDVLTFSKKVWKEGERKLEANLFTPAEAEEMLADAWVPIANGTQYIAGFETPSGKQIALSRESKIVQVFAEPVQIMIPGCKLVKNYDKDATRSSNLKAQAPRLAVGHPAYSFHITTRSAMKSFMEIYEGLTESQPTVPIKQLKSLAMVKVPINQILYGPPGTGKTYNTINKALEILDPIFLTKHSEDRSALKSRFDELKERGRIGFTTFHQSFSYEDFIEGLKASAGESGQVSYEIEDGIFKRMCDTAQGQSSTAAIDTISTEGRKVWKMSLGNTQGDESYVYDDCIAEGVIRLGYGHALNFQDALDWYAVKKVHEESGIDVTDTDYSIKVTNYFVNEMTKGDLVIVSDGNLRFRAVAEIIGDYYYDELREDWFKQTRKVRWLRTYKPSIPVEQLLEKVFSQQTLYKLGTGTLKPARLQELLGSHDQSNNEQQFTAGESFNSYYVKAATKELLRLTKPNGSKLAFDMEMLEELAGLVQTGRISIEDIRQKKVFEKIPETSLEKYLVNGYNNILPLLIEQMVSNSSKSKVDEPPTAGDAYVLIIDEINRGNIANIFGELITLIEDSKRSGQPEALEVTLPYSKKAFSVPDNLYIIGTMNTADRSLIHIDTALRRRFEFEPMMPNENLLKDIPAIDGINVQRMLKAINDRITVLYDREHTIGHSFFLPLKGVSKPTVKDLAQIFDRKILPLLEEYFFEDWSRIRLVLNDDYKPTEAQIVSRKFDKEVVATLFGNESVVSGAESIFERNQEALLNPQAYIGIYKALDI